MKWIKYSEQKPTEPGYYICKHYYKEVPEVVAGVDYMEFKDGGFWSEDEIYKLMWLDESSPPCQCERYREVLEKIIEGEEKIYQQGKDAADWFNNNTDGVGQTVAYQSYPDLPGWVIEVKALLADGGKEDVTN